MNAGCMCMQVCMCIHVYMYVYLCVSTFKILYCHFCQKYNTKIASKLSCLSDLRKISIKTKIAHQ